MKYLVLLVMAFSGVSIKASAQNHPGGMRPDRPGNYLEQRVRNLEGRLESIEWRLRQLEQGGIPNPSKGYYCIAQCRGNSSTAAGGGGKSEAEAKNAAFDAVRKNWTCHMEVVECSRED